MSSCIQLKLFYADNGYMFTEIDGRVWLVDTGCPGSICCPSKLPNCELRFNDDHVFTVAQQLTNISLADIKKYVSSPDFVGLLGMNILSKFDVMFNVDDQQLCLLPPAAYTASSACCATTATLYLKPMCCGLPALDGTINGKRARMVLDTGSCLTFLGTDEYTPSEQALPKTHFDFNLTTGHFSTFLAKRSVVLGPDFQYNCDCGVLPEGLQKCLKSRGIAGIVSNTIFKGRIVTLSWATGRVFVTQRW